MMARQNISCLYNTQNYWKTSIGKLENMLWPNEGFHIILIPVARDWKCPIDKQSTPWLPITTSALGQNVLSLESS